MDKCLFCRIVDKEVRSHRLYEDDMHIAILDIYPSVRGQSLILPKRHVGSYVFDMKDGEYTDLMAATKKVAKLVDRKLGALRTCMVMEGMEVDHAHIKLYPIFEVAASVSPDTIDLNKYPGYISTQHGKRMSDEELEVIATLFQ